MSWYLSLQHRHVTLGSGYPFWQPSIDHNMDVYYQVKHRLQASTLAKKFDISLWFPCGADRWTATWLAKFLEWIDYQILSGMGLHPLMYASCAHGAPLQALLNLILDSCQKRYSQLPITQTLANWPVSYYCMLYAGSGANFIEVACFFLNSLLTSYWFLTIKYYWSQAQVHYFKRNPVCFLLMAKVELLQKDTSFGLG